MTTLSDVIRRYSGCFNVIKLSCTSLYADYIHKVPLLVYDVQVVAAAVRTPLHPNHKYIMNQYIMS